MDGGGNTIARVYTALFVFCGVGGGAIGFQRARVQMRGLGLSASFRILGGIESDPGTAADFTRLTGAPCLNKKVEEITPEELIEFCGGVVPDVVFFSPPCKASSGLLAPELAASPKYQEMAQLALVWLRLMLATWGSRVRMVLMENVPRIRTRHAPMMAEARRLLDAAGYLLHDEAHNLGEVGGLAQNRDRLLLAARHRSVKQFLYKPVKRRVRGVGEVLEKLPLPGDPKAGPLHALPELDPITAIRLALIPAGGDWHDLPEKVVLPPELAENLGGKAGRRAKPSERKPFNDVWRVVRWGDAVGAVTSGDTPSAGVTSVADPRVTERGHAMHWQVREWETPSCTVTGSTDVQEGAPSIADPRVTGTSAFDNNYVVTGWEEPARTVIGKIQLGSGAGSVADPRLHLNDNAHDNLCKVTGWEDPSGTVTGANRPASGGASIADPRTGEWSHPHTYGVLPWDGPAHTVTGNDAPGGGPHSVADPRAPEAFNGSLGVTSWDAPSDTVTSREGPTNGRFTVADPRAVTGNDGVYGVAAWEAPSGAVTTSPSPSSGRFTVADPRAVEGYDHAWGVMPWTESAGAITSRDAPSNGRFSVADPRITCKTFENSGIYGIVRWNDPAYTVVAHACHDNGPHSVADPRSPRRVPPGPPCSAMRRLPAIMFLGCRPNTSRIERLKCAESG